MKMAVFWVVAPCSQKFIDVSVVLAASISRAMIALMVEQACIFYLHVYQ
jgi:hypothetical protein